MTDPAQSEAIEIREGPGGMTAFIPGSRIRVSDIARYYQLMLDEVIVERIQRAFPHLTERQIASALDYWRTHEAEVAAEIEEEMKLLEQIPTVP